MVGTGFLLFVGFGWVVLLVASVFVAEEDNGDDGLGTVVLLFVGFGRVVSLVSILVPEEGDDGLVGTGFLLFVGFDTD